MNITGLTMDTFRPRNAVQPLEPPSKKAYTSVLPINNKKIDDIRKTLVIEPAIPCAPGTRPRKTIQLPPSRLGLKELCRSPYLNSGKTTYTLRCKSRWGESKTILNVTSAIIALKLPSFLNSKWWPKFKVKGSFKNSGRPPPAPATPTWLSAHLPAHNRKSPFCTLLLATNMAWPGCPPPAPDIYDHRWCTGCQHWFPTTSHNFVRLLGYNFVTTGHGRSSSPPPAAAIMPCLPLCKWLSSLHWPPTWPLAL
ncbi:hypothetical protein PR048_020191 [Dryococelus australis]|uniref:Uncharacterized protein n=1 Tax=Dryococelus australis TaxID=614101 RepID=A0ABQ9H5M8_9NEOP|nr:hypothetical protein PR048_020191 [Dryococelus australis]